MRLFNFRQGRTWALLVHQMSDAALHHAGGAAEVLRCVTAPEISVRAKTRNSLVPKSLLRTFGPGRALGVMRAARSQQPKLCKTRVSIDVQILQSAERTRSPEVH